MKVGVFDKHARHCMAEDRKNKFVEFVEPIPIARQAITLIPVILFCNWNKQRRERHCLHLSAAAKEQAIDIGCRKIGIDNAYNGAA